jgi:DNA-binding protein HU-beta
VRKIFNLYPDKQEIYSIIIYIFAHQKNYNKPKPTSMTKADIVTKISDRLGVEKIETQAIVEQFMKEVKNSLETGENVYLRGFGSFIIKTRAEKKGRNISKNVTISIPAQNIPAFKPAKVFVDRIKEKVKVT